MRRPWPCSLPLPQALIWPPHLLSCRTWPIKPSDTASSTSLGAPLVDRHYITCSSTNESLLLHLCVLTASPPRFELRVREARSVWLLLERHLTEIRLPEGPPSRHFVGVRIFESEGVGGADTNSHTVSRAFTLTPQPMCLLKVTLLASARFSPTAPSISLVSRARQIFWSGRWPDTSTPLCRSSSARPGRNHPSRSSYLARAMRPARVASP